MQEVTGSTPVFSTNIFHAIYERTQATSRIFIPAKKGSFTT
jgi:hypothetical protein